MADPFDALHLPPRPVAPDPGFAASLRARLVEALVPEPPDPDAVPTISLRGGDTVSTTEPDTTATLSPYLAVRDAAAALDWYRDVLGAIETTRFVGDDGRVGHAEVNIGGARLLLADEYPDAGHHGPVHYGGTPVTLHLEGVDVDHTFDRALGAGAEGERPPADQGHGNRNATIRDPFGHRWMLSQAIDASRAEEASGREDGGATRGFTIRGRRPVEPGYLTMRTGDLTRARAFFGELFAWDVEPGSQEGGGHIANTHFPMGFMESDGDGDGGAGPVRLYFRVDDIEPYAARVTELGGQVLSRNQYPSGGNAECVDDQGFRFDLLQPAPGY
ncbi:VOC family protein [Iamia sp.]|uniref:VOC family protein n=1 Tax=Iamia sp. TaxID=2722710 RepID=UPI002BD01112|nr:VOC family protein [Iamia sp.]HXH57478.1 VOC family protein [Iamia sp.]